MSLARQILYEYLQEHNLTFIICEYAWPMDFYTHFTVLKEPALTLCSNTVLDSKPEPKKSGKSLILTFTTGTEYDFKRNLYYDIVLNKTNATTKKEHKDPVCYNNNVSKTRLNRQPELFQRSSILKSAFVSLKKDFVSLYCFNGLRDLTKKYNVVLNDDINYIIEKDKYVPPKEINFSLTRTLIENKNSVTTKTYNMQGSKFLFETDFEHILLCENYNWPDPTLAIITDLFTIDEKITYFIKASNILSYQMYKQQLIVLYNNFVTLKLCIYDIGCITSNNSNNKPIALQESLASVVKKFEYKFHQQASIVTITDNYIVVKTNDYTLDVFYYNL